MTATIARRARTRLMPRKKYLIGGAGALSAYADSLEEAKKAGEAIARREFLKGKWNVSFITIPILVADSLGSSRYVSTGWKMYVPVRGTGTSYRDIVTRIRSRHGVNPMVWTKKNGGS